ncbi:MULTISPECIES: recombinase family protein [unclassified Microbacterium]|uniref:recombinase family protein n=1 Tax=unclassified Microbacterium TaxID=2609290 RepID=UPI000EAAB417|nr:MULTISPECIES: recombinase family protein [unclassified Microbacterium]MBT2484864.1 recombinase family protein [Microbacterium sp. ISL-108]RKN69533.1 recombinase family protein [Microbacterium sp. CGR2]
MSVRAAIYLRISIDRHGDGLAIDRQRSDCEKIARDRGWEITQTYSDSVSASKRDVRRPGYDRMRTDYEAGNFDALVCWDLDRLTRQPRQLEDWIDLATDRDLIVVTANGEADLSTDGGRMYARIKASVARAEVERKSARQKRSNEQNAERGFSHRGNRPFGWELGGNQVRESEAVHIREAARIILEGGSLRSVIRYFESHEISAPRGGRWTNASVRTLLTRHRIAGILVRGGIAQPVSQIQPILDRETWEELRAIILDPDRRANRGRTPSEAWLAGVLTCPCGARLGSSWKHSRGSKTRTYVCRAVIETTDGFDGQHVSIAASIAESSAMAALYAALGAGAETGEDTAVADLRAQLAGIDEQRARAEEVYALTGSTTSLSLLQRYSAERGEVRLALDRALAQRGTERILEGARGAWAASGIDFDLWSQSLSTFARSFRVMETERKRSLAQATVVGHLTREGRGGERIVWMTTGGDEIGRI